jgi:hypothetical protein
VEDGASSELRFINWARAQLPPHAVYALTDYLPQPDTWCLTLALLPALPFGPGHEVAGWQIALGGEPPELVARIAARDPAVRVFRPGFVVARLGR